MMKVDQLVPVIVSSVLGSVILILVFIKPAIRENNIAIALSGFLLVVILYNPLLAEHSIVWKAIEVDVRLRITLHALLQITGLILIGIIVFIEIRRKTIKQNRVGVLSVAMIYVASVYVWFLRDIGERMLNR